MRTEWKAVFGLALLLASPAYAETRMHSDGKEYVRYCDSATLQQRSPLCMYTENKNLKEKFEKSVRLKVFPEVLRRVEKCEESSFRDVLAYLGVEKCKTEYLPIAQADQMIREANRSPGDQESSRQTKVMGSPERAPTSPLRIGELEISPAD